YYDCRLPASHVEISHVACVSDNTCGFRPSLPDLLSGGDLAALSAFLHPRPERLRHRERSRFGRNKRVCDLRRWCRFAVQRSTYAVCCAQSPLRIFVDFHVCVWIGPVTQELFQMNTSSIRLSYLVIEHSQRVVEFYHIIECRAIITFDSLVAPRKNALKFADRIPISAGSMIGTA